MEGIDVRPGGQPKMAQLMKQAQKMQAQKMQAQLAQAQAELADVEVEGSAGGGLVRAKVTGGGELVSIAVDATVVDPSDVETLEALVVAAIRDAQRAKDAVTAEKMGPLSGGLGGLGLPGM